MIKEIACKKDNEAGLLIVHRVLFSSYLIVKWIHICQNSLAWIIHYFHRKWELFL